MKLWFGIMLAVWAGLGLSALAQPPQGSQLPPEENGCALCHGEDILWADEQRRMYIAQSIMQMDVHSLSGVNCHDCHGGNPSTLDIEQAHATAVAGNSAFSAFRESPGGAEESCGVCHQEIELLLRKSVHAKAEREDDSMPGDVLKCSRCHGASMHGMLPVKDPRSPVFLNQQVTTCGACHEEDEETFKQTVHGTGVYQAGLVMAAVCADCHGAHGIYYAADRRSTLHIARVGETCGRCHEGLDEIVQESVHGRQAVSASAGETGGDKSWHRAPACTDCHQGHRLLRTSSGSYRAEITNYCGNCHPDLTGSYAMSTHGELTELGYAAAAKCSDCHGSHRILAMDDVECMLAAGENRLATCRQCHVNAVSNFTQFDPHADHKNAEKYPKLHTIYVVTRGLFFGFMAYFVIHALLWFVRAFVTVLRHGRHRTLVAGRYVVTRFTPLNRVIYLTLLVSFLGLTATGLPLKYSTQHWAHVYVGLLGGFEYTSVWHHIFGAIAIVCCAAHVVLVVLSIGKRRKHREGWKAMLFGPDSPVPSVRDAKDMFGMAKWFFGLGPKPTFERWTYWEKYDYWMAIIACVVVGTSGLMMWYPNLFCRWMSGESLNVARVIHVELAVLTTSFLFVFHFYHTHFRPEKFPMDLSAVTGLVSEDHLREQRPAFVARLEEHEQLPELRRPAPSRQRLWLLLLSFAVVSVLGLSLLGVALAASLGK